MKYSVTLAGQCDLLQTNFVFSRKDREHFGYYPLLCGRDAGEVCRVTLTAADAQLQAAVYNVKLYITSRNTDGSFNTNEWDMGIMDFSYAHIPPVHSQRTADQTEDSFEKVHLENRPPFTLKKSDSSVVMSVAFTLLLLLFWVYLITVWSRLGLLKVPMRNISRLSLIQKLFYLMFLGWLGLAVSNWLGLGGTFSTIKIGVTLALPTTILGIMGLREAARPTLHSGNANDNGNDTCKKLN